MPGIHKVTVEQLREERKAATVTRNQVIFVNRREYFKAPKTEETLFRELHRRFEGRDRYMAPVVQRYSDNYRHVISKRSVALSRLRSVAKSGRSRDIYFVIDDPLLPDADILIDIIRRQVNNGVW